MLTVNTVRWCALGLASCVAQTSLAADAVSGQNAESSGRRMLEEVVVSAQKVEQSSQDVPISLTAVSGDFMREVGATGLQDIAPYIPNVRFSSDTDPALAQINIRGFGSNPLNSAFDSSVGFVQDEVFFNRPSYYNEAMFDIARVEVLRGPQGTLFGKNTIAGVFNVTTKGPTEEFSADFRVNKTDPDEVSYEGGVGGMVTDWFGVRVAAQDISRDGQLHNQFLNRQDDEHEQNAQRIKLLFLPSENVSVELMAVTSETSANYWGLQLMNLDEGSSDFLRNYDPNIEDDPYNFTSSYDQDGFLDKTSDTLSMKTDWDIGPVGALNNLNMVLVLADTSLTIDSLVDLDTSPADLAALEVVSDYEQQSAELRFSGTADNLFGIGSGVEFVVGAYFFDSRFSQQTQITAGSDFGAYLLTDDALQLVSGQTSVSSGGLLGGLNLAGIGLISDITGAAIGDDYLQLDYLLNVDAQAIFAQMTWALTDQFIITPGIRFSREQKVADASGAGFCQTAALGTPCLMELALSAEDYDERGLSRKETDVSPKLSFQYYLNSDSNVFLTYSRGYKSGGFNASSFGGEDLGFDPEEAATIEAGFKGEFFDNTLRLNAAVYQTQFDNLQVLAFNGAFFDVTNAASAISRGLEMDFVWLTPFEPLTIAGSLGLLDAKYDSYPNAPAPVTSGLNSNQDLSGKRIAFAPEQSASFTPTLTLPVFGLAMRASVDYLYQGNQFTDGDLDPNSYLEGFSQISARISIGAWDQRWALTLGGSNLTDEKVLNQVLDTVFFPGSYNARQKSGRKVFASLSFAW
ncbi:TonB-dependent receptor [uncultured Zhongshania sp.]|jgi:outer membrane receptor protein involved in Fe transport|uniref:TonB-dependent receptor n=1 Tax=uncultured Zhongshania sp. TaxID=1642288 RepID=UPI0025D31DC9|nr:TonB-dependent receptor [uncultured Zhongshania sp.]